MPLLFILLKSSSSINYLFFILVFFFSSRRRHTRLSGDWSSDVCSSDLRWIFTATLSYSAVLAVILWFVAPGFVWLFGAKYHGIEHMIHWLCLVVPGMALRLAAGSVLMALGKPWMRVGFEVAGLVVLIIASVILTAHFHAVGMPLALACSEWSMATVGVMLLYSVCRRDSGRGEVFSER